MAITRIRDGTCVKCGKQAYVVHICATCAKLVCPTCQPGGPFTDCYVCVANRPKVVIAADPGAAQPATTKISYKALAGGVVFSGLVACKNCKDHGFFSWRDASWPPGHWAIEVCNRGCKYQTADDAAAAQCAGKDIWARWLAPVVGDVTVFLRGGETGTHQLEPGLLRA